MAFMLEHNTAAHKFFSAVALTPRRANHGVHPSRRARDGAVARCFLYSFDARSGVTSESKIHD